MKSVLALDGMSLNTYLRSLDVIVKVVTESLDMGNNVVTSLASQVS